jgi:hypothetical protein
MTDSKTTRRRFLVAAIAFSGLTAGTIGPAALRFGAAWAQSGDAGNKDTLVRLARLMLPHAGLSDDVYAEVLSDALTTTADDSTTIAARLDTQQADAFMDLDEEAQLVVMRAIESDELFTAILASLKTNLYGHPKVWGVMDYEGPSYQDGGYLNRGAGEIDWLPEGE